MLNHAQAQAALIVLALLPDSLDIMDFGEQVELYEPLAGLGGGRKRGYGMPDKPEPVQVTAPCITLMSGGLTAINWSATNEKPKQLQGRS